ncbi:MAG: bifunctional diaminohydroxyphosphoribosylaminopyrimidine deaminase/5-amino-6-(5-phosphoribosylamino)uracil reductase RibD [Planctomycetota bacterium]|nr:bifunctional diaminohydroxyphosphoribosylaminopyrimidine deaminase/5-amino-6-(5-phosphoribosylamino)uracil reductase RibD [Planctomycetota bacterium]
MLAGEAHALRRCVTLAVAHRGDVEPNPPVGAVLLREDQPIAEGAHKHFGAFHAETEALSVVTEKIDGATLVVTLEPCSTFGKQPPCTDAVIAAGIRRVVVGSVDPHPDHAGKGLEKLKLAGVDVELVNDPDCEALLEDFRESLKRCRPHVLLKWAMSREGGIAPAVEPEGFRPRVQLSGEEALARVHLWRGFLDGIVVGVGTVVADDPRLTARGSAKGQRPLRRIVLDPSLRTPTTSTLVCTAAEMSTWIYATDEAKEGRQARLERAGVVVHRVPGGPSWCNGVFDSLGKHGVNRVMVEGGSHTLTALLELDLADQLAVILTPSVLGEDCLPAITGLDLSGSDPAVIARKLHLDEVRSEPLGDDVLLRGIPRKGLPGTVVG